MGFVLVALLGAASTAQLESKEMVDGIRSILPEVEAGHINDVLHADGTLWYTHATMQPQYQQGIGGNADQSRTTFIRTSYNTAGNRDHSGGNANVLFPWGTVAGGTHRTDGCKSYKALHLPRDANGDILPVVVHSTRIEQNFSDGTISGTGWRFPVGSTLIEVLAMRRLDPKDDEKHYFVYEIRSRHRERTEWTFSVFRPFRTAQDFVDDARSRRPGRSEQTESALQQIESGSHVGRYKMYDEFRTRHAFNEVAYQQIMPDLQDDSLIREQLVDTEFVDVFGETWVADGDGNEVYCPSTAADFHIVPASYDGAFLGSDSLSCMRCHDATQRPSRRFDRGLEWYGQVRGSDGILSFRPVGNAGLNDKLHDGGLVARYDPIIHTTEHYTTIRGLR